MTTVEERVKGFLEAWKNIGDPHCTECGEELVDGNFAMIEGKFVCLKCWKIKVQGHDDRKSD